MLTRSIVVALVLVVVAPPAAAESGTEWWYPYAGVAKLYSFDDSLVEPEVDDRAPLVMDSYTVPFHHSVLEQMELVEEGTVETRVHADFSGAGLGAGSGLGKGGSQLTFADANAAAARAAGTAVAQSNAKIAVKSVRGAAAAKSKHVPAALSWFQWMRLSLSFAFVVKALCMMCNIFYQASPLPLIGEFKAKGDTGEADLAPFVAVAYGGWQWCFYGLFAYIVTSKSGFLVLVYSNVVGATLGLYYVYAFTLNCRNAAMLQRSTKYYYVLACIVMIQFVAIESLEPVRALFFCGLISSSWSTIASLSLISTVPAVYEQRNSRSLPMPLLFMGEISATLWIVCGVMLWDPWITFPNIFSLTVCSFALYLCWKFPPHGCDGDDALDDDHAAVVASAKEKEADIDEASCGFDGGRASPLQRAVGFVLRSSANEKEPFAECSSRQSYGGTGGTGDGF